MSAPRVFISSTYYDLKQVRYNIGDFIKSLGYEPVMHERSGVAYTQEEPLEQDCYHELAGCDIVVCIIGNKFGTQSSENKLSITMNEIQTAIKHKKKVYIFIAKDVFIENRTYEQNRGIRNFKPAYADNLKIHEFVSELKNNVKIHVIEPFETTDDIIGILRSQFAGLFQNLLAREASHSDSKTAYDLQQSADEIRDAIRAFEDSQEYFFRKFDSTALGRNCTLNKIEHYLGIKKSAIFAKNIEALDEIMGIFGFQSITVDNESEDIRKYTKGAWNTNKYALVLKKELFDENGMFMDIRTPDILEKNIIWDETEYKEDELPF